MYRSFHFRYFSFPPPRNAWHWQELFRRGERRRGLLEIWEKSHWGHPVLDIFNKAEDGGEDGGESMTSVSLHTWILPTMPSDARCLAMHMIWACCTQGLGSLTLIPLPPCHLPISANPFAALNKGEAIELNWTDRALDHREQYTKLVYFHMTDLVDQFKVTWLVYPS